MMSSSQFAKNESEISPKKRSLKEGDEQDRDNVFSKKAKQTTTKKKTTENGRNSEKEDTFAKASTKSNQVLSESNEWRKSNCGTLLYFYPCSACHSAKIAAFDIDGTVITTKSGKKFASNDLTDWKLWSDQNAKKEFQSLDSSGYRIVFFTNQEGISKGKVNQKDWTRKIENVIERLNLKNKVTVLASLNRKENNYRKPHTGMWDFLCNSLSGGGNGPDISESFYVGDAAGRPKRAGAKKDFSCTDYKFALNIGLKFLTPEQFYYKSKQPVNRASLETSLMGFQPKVHWSKYLDWPLDKVESIIKNLLSSCNDEPQEIIVIVGSPASGKSSVTSHILDRFSKDSSRDYVRVNQDTLKTVDKCVEATKQAIMDEKSAVVDNTNRDIKTRALYIDVAKALGVCCRCVWMKTTKQESLHLNAFRGAAGIDAESTEKRSVPDVVIHSFYKNMIEPTVSEGFKQVVDIPFAPGPFPTEERKRLFYMFTH